MIIMIRSRVWVELVVQRLSIVTDNLSNVPETKITIALQNFSKISIFHVQVPIQFVLKYAQLAVILAIDINNGWVYTPTEICFEP